MVLICIVLPMDGRDVTDVSDPPIPQVPIQNPFATDSNAADINGSFGDSSTVNPDVDLIPRPQPVHRMVHQRNI